MTAQFDEKQRQKILKAFSDYRKGENFSPSQFAELIEQTDTVKPHPDVKLMLGRLSYIKCAFEIFCEEGTVDFSEQLNAKAMLKELRKLISNLTVQPNKIHLED